MVEWLGRLTVVWKVAGSGHFRTKDWKTLTVHPAVNGYVVNFREGLRRRKEMLGRRHSYAVPKTRLGSNTSLPPTAIRLRVRLAFLLGMNWMWDLIISASTDCFTAA